jgi:hypothetical protein
LLPGRALTEPGYAGTFTASVANTGLATVASAAPGTFVVTAGSTPGSSNVVIADDRGQSVAVRFTLTITTGTISSHGRAP